MKKFYAFVLAMMICMAAFVLSSCGGSKGENAEGAAEAATIEVTPEIQQGIEYYEAYVSQFADAVKQLAGGDTSALDKITPLLKSLQGSAERFSQMKDQLPANLKARIEKALNQESEAMAQYKKLATDKVNEVVDQCTNDAVDALKDALKK